jgi:HemY protein
MLKFLILVAVLFAVALGFNWLKDTSGEVALTIGDTAYVLDLTTAAVALIAAILLTMGLLWFLQELVRAPGSLARRWRDRNIERGRNAASQGLIAVAAGDLRTAERATQEASRRIPGQPLARLLQAQTAQLKGDRSAARQIFHEMTEDPATRIAGLRGLYIEAEREGEREAAHIIAEQARIEAPSAPWAARALLRHQIAAADWDAALRTLAGAADGRILDKRAARRQRAVILAAKALDAEEGDPDRARQAAVEAHDLAPDLVPAAVVAGRLLSRQGDIRRATRILEAAWKAGPHPDLADAYTHVRTGDSANDRLKRAEVLHRMQPEADEGRLGVARAAIDARDFSRARDVLTPVLTTRPTQNALMVMAELEEAETGDRGRAREWQARAVRAPRDPVWTADGMILDKWAPASPVTGRIDAVEWKVPVAELEAPRLEIDAAELHAPALPAPDSTSIAEVVAAETQAGAAPAAPVGQGDDVQQPVPPARSAPAPAAAAPLAAGSPVAAEPPSGPAAVPAAAQVQRTNGSGGKAAAGEAIPPPHGAVPPGAEREPAFSDPQHPRPPDDPGIPDAEPAEEEPRRFRLF